jgi:predicted aspartyl protease
LPDDDGSIWITFLLNGKECLGFVDSGAKISLIDEQFAADLQLTKDEDLLMSSLLILQCLLFN